MSHQIPILIVYEKPSILYLVSVRFWAISHFSIFVQTSIAWQTQIFGLTWKLWFSKILRMVQTFDWHTMKIQIRKFSNFSRNCNEIWILIKDFEFKVLFVMWLGFRTVNREWVVLCICHHMKNFHFALKAWLQTVAIFQDKWVKILFM